MFHDPYSGFQTTILENGLPIHHKECPNVPWFYAGIVIHAGAREDPPGREGLAHFVEHLVSENIEGITFTELEKRFKQLGGHGWFGRTSYLASKYSFHFPADESKLKEAFTWFGKMLLAAKIQRNITEEKEVIQHEYHRKYEHHQARQWALQGRPYLFANHPRLGSFDAAIGVLDELMQCTVEDLQAFYDTYYTAKNMSIVCLGAIPLQHVLHIIQETPFSLLSGGLRNAIPPAFSPHSPQKHEQTIHMSEFFTIAVTQTTCTFEWVLPLCFSRYCVRLFSDMLEEQLTEELRYKRSLTYDVSVEVEHYQDCRTLYVSFEVPPDSLEVSKDLLWQALGSLQQEKFLEVKKERVQCIYRMDCSGYDLLQDAIGDLEGYQRLIPFSQELHQIEQTTFEEVMKLAEYLSPEKHFCFIVQP
ncbi:MAG TPA: pitrilysin family protein [Nitrososphaera sp.]